MLLLRSEQRTALATHQLKESHATQRGSLSGSWERVCGFVCDDVFAGVRCVWVCGNVQLGRLSSAVKQRALPSLAFLLSDGRALHKTLQAIVLACWFSTSFTMQITDFLEPGLGWKCRDSHSSPSLLGEAVAPGGSGANESSHCLSTSKCLDGRLQVLHDQWLLLGPGLWPSCSESRNTTIRG